MPDTHTTDPMRPTRTLCKLATPGLDWQGDAPSCKRCASKRKNLERMGPELVAYWSNSITASVQADVDAGRFTLVRV